MGMKDIKIPKLTERLIHSRLSEMIHRPYISTKVFTMPDEDKTFQN